MEELLMTLVGRSVDTPLLFGIHYITWWGARVDPEGDGYCKLFWKFYYKKRNENP
jgi:hypothetical protein